MHLMSFLHYTAFWIYSLLIYFVLKKDRTSQLNRSVAYLIASVALVSFSFSFIQNTCSSHQIGRLFLFISSLGWISMPGFFIWFVLVFTGNAKKIDKKAFFIFIVVPVLILIYQNFSGKLVIDCIKVPYGWGTIWAESIWYYFYWLFCFIIGVSGFLMMLKVARHAKEKNEKKQAMIMLVLLSVTLSVIFITDGVLPKLDIRIFPEMTDLICLVWVLGLVYVIAKYNFMEFTTLMASDDIISTMWDSLLLISPGKKILEVNSYTLKLLRYEKKDLLYKSVDILFPEGHENPFSENRFGMLEKVGRVKLHDIFYRSKIGENIPVSFSATVKRDHKNRTLGIVVIARDIRDLTMLHKKENELIAATTAFKIEKSKTEELRNAYNELKEVQNMLIHSERLRALGRLGASIAHEIKSPLAGVLSLINLYKRKKDPDSDEFRDLTEIQLGCVYIGKIVEDMNTFARESTGEFVDLDLNEAIEMTLSFTVPQLKDKNIRIEKELQDGLPPIKGDMRHLQQVIINLINNGRDAITGEDGLIKIITGFKDTGGRKYIELQVIDNGCGMSKEVREKVFDQFFTTKKEGKGLGLGMSIVHSIIKAHNGEILIESEPGTGTVFTVRFLLK